MHRSDLAVVAAANMTSMEYRLFYFLLSKVVDFDYFIVISHKEVAEELNVKPITISRALRGLCDRSVITEGPRLGERRSYRFNSNFDLDTVKNKKSPETKIVKLDSFRKKSDVQEVWQQQA